MIIGYAIPAVQKFQGAAYKSLYYQALEISKADGATPDDNPCLIARGDELYRAGVGAVPSVLIVPQFVKPGAVYTQIPTPTLEGGDFDQFTFTRATTATRVNASGLIESVASGILRLDYPIGGGCPAGLIEPAGTNGAPNVQYLRGVDTPAASGGLTITTGSTDFLAPDGTSGSITKYVGGAASGSTQYAYFTGFLPSISVAGVYIFSLFVKAGATNPLNFCALQFTAYTGGSGTSISYFSLASGTALTAGASIQDYGNGWYRLISAPYTIASGDLAGNLVFVLAEGNNDTTWPASGALNLTAYTWGAQVEAGAIPTSYIPTTTASATRAADVCSVSGVSGYIGQTEGTLYVEWDISRLNAGNFGFNIDNGSVTEYVSIARLSSTGAFRLAIKKSSGAEVNLITSSAFSTGIGMTLEDVKRIKNIPFTQGPNGGFCLHLPDQERIAKHPITPRYIEVLEYFKSVQHEIQGFYVMCMGEVHEDVKHIFPTAHVPEFWSRAGNLLGEAIIKPELQKFQDRFKHMDHGDQEMTCGCVEDLYHNVVLPNGDVSLCCMDYGLKHIIGNIFEQDYDDIIPAPFTTFKLCQTCENGIKPKNN